jgi:hypothetical protein
MQLHGIKARAKRKYEATIESSHSLPVTLNLLAREFNPGPRHHLHRHRRR